MKYSWGKFASHTRHIGQTATLVRRINCTLLARNHRRCGRARVELQPPVRRRGRPCDAEAARRVRFCFPKRDETLLEAGRRLQALRR